MAADSVGDLLKLLSKPSARIVDTSLVRRLAKLTEVCKSYLFAAATILVRGSSHGHAAFRSYSSDGTPILTMERYSLPLRGAKVTRKARQLNEFLMERLVYQCIDEQGEVITKTIITDPLPLTSGKGSWSLFACLQRWPTLREMGFRDLAISHYCWDRGCFSALATLSQKLHARESAASLRDMAELEGLTNWCFVNGDVLHDTMNAWLWGFKPFIPSDTCMKDIFIIISSVRNSFDIILKEMPSWLASRVELTDNPWPEEALLEQWSLLGVEEPVIEVLVDLRLRWAGDKLEIFSEHAGHPTAMEDISGALLGVWRLRKFSESRWLGLGPSFRALLAAEMTGLTDLVHYALARKKGRHSDYYLGGYSRLNDSIRQVLVIGAFGSFVCEALLEELLIDDRVVKRYDMLRDLCQAELDRTTLISDPVMATFGQHCGCDAARLRSHIISCALASAAYFSGRVFDVVEEWPWRLALGNKRANLRSLKEAPAPWERTARQVWTLVQHGYSEHKLVEGLGFVENAPWSSRVVEQLHGSSAQVAKYHPDMGLASFQCRSFLHAIRALATPTRDAQDQRRMQQRLVKFEARSLRRLTGRQVYLKRCAEAIGASCGADKASPEPPPAQFCTRFVLLLF